MRSLLLLFAANGAVAADIDPAAERERLLSLALQWGGGRTGPAQPGGLRARPARSGERVIEFLPRGMRKHQQAGAGARLQRNERDSRARAAGAVGS
eukprot:gene9396-6626_t